MSNLNNIKPLKVTKKTTNYEPFTISRFNFSKNSNNVNYKKANISYDNNEIIDYNNNQDLDSKEKSEATTNSLDVETKKKTDVKIDEIVKELDSEVGNGPTKYRTWFYGYDNSGVDWCAIFVNWIFNHDGNSGLFIEKESGQAGAGYSCRDSVKAGYGKWYSTWNVKDRSSIKPQPGDVVTFVWDGDVTAKENSQDKYWSSHVAYVYKVENNRIYIIEGNAASSNANSAIVDNSRSFDINDSRINGYYRPNYENLDK